MPIKKHSNEIPSPHKTPSVLVLLKTPLEPDIVRYRLHQKIEGYRQQMVKSERALTELRERRNDLLRQLAEEEARAGRSRRF